MRARIIAGVPGSWDLFERDVFELFVGRKLPLVAGPGSEVPFSRIRCVRILLGGKFFSGKEEKLPQQTVPVGVCV